MDSSKDLSCAHRTKENDITVTKLMEACTSARTMLNLTGLYCDTSVHGAMHNNAHEIIEIDCSHEVEACTSAGTVQSSTELQCNALAQQRSAESQNREKN